MLMKELLFEQLVDEVGGRKESNDPVGKRYLYLLYKGREIPG